MANTVLPDGRGFVNVIVSKTLALSDQGTVQNVAVSSTLTLPATTAGAVFSIRNGGGAIGSGAPAGALAAGAVTITVAPNSVDQIAGLGFTATDNKAAINTLGQYGDELILVGDGTNGWGVLTAKGTWTRAA